ncbi:reverse transcriptase-rnase h-integrase [Moniliophthora roreri]|uniref:Retrotransposon gag domain-containing protein n=1 Tax=Moniliophthora roreri TaxID=221103 RepID=A0A0W0FVZ8_MONRR|nr:reverse transcriptase-rnase h-integrase [Moniliophthora roreri]
MAAEESDLDNQLEVAEQLLNPNPKRTPCQITRSQRRGAVESLQQERTEPRAKSSKPDPFDEYRNIFHTPTPEMTTPAGSTAAASDVQPKIEHDNTDKQWAQTISTAVLQTIDDKKDEASKGPTLDPFLGKQSDTRRFLLDLQLYFAMNPVKANTDEKKKMLLLSLVKGNTTEWKQRETMKLFSEDDDPEEKKKAAEETWSSFKQRFRNEWQPVNIVREAQTKIEQIKMTDRADEYVNRFRLIAMDTKYDDEALMKFFREGLPESLQNKIMLQTDGEPETLDNWYKLVIKYDDQYKLVMANRKRELIKPKIARKEKEVTVGRMLSESDRKDYMVAGKCFHCAKTSHVS